MSSNIILLKEYYSPRLLSRTLEGSAKKFEIVKVLKLRQKITKTNYEKVKSNYPASTRHGLDVERLMLTKEKNKLI